MARAPRPRDCSLTSRGRGARATQLTWSKVKIMADKERSRHLHSGSGARSLCRISRRKIWRPASHRAVRAGGHHASGRAASRAALAMDAAGGGLCSRCARLAMLLLTEKPYRAQIYESFLGFLTGIAGAYGGAIGAQRVGGIVEVRMQLLHWQLALGIQHSAFPEPKAPVILSAACSSRLARRTTSRRIPMSSDRIHPLFPRRKAAQATRNLRTG